MDTVARRMWTLFEPIHAVTYFTPEARGAYEEAGLRGFWRGYFAGRAAALGAVGPAPVTATFYGFVPRLVERAVPGVWSLLAPDDALRVREAGAVASLRRLVGDPPLDDALTLLDRVLDSLDCGGRVLAAANAALPRPTEPLARLWHAATVLREHRGDGHVAALVSAIVDGCESLVWRAGLDTTRETLQPARGWTDEEWDAAVARLARRAYLTAEGVATETGRSRRAMVEEATDAAAAPPWTVLSTVEIERLVELLRPVAVACHAELPYAGLIGLPAPA